MKYGFICRCGETLYPVQETEVWLSWECPKCKTKEGIPKDKYDKLFPHRKP